MLNNMLNNAFNNVLNNVLTNALHLTLLENGVTCTKQTVTACPF